MGQVVSAAITYVVTATATVVGNGVYEIGRVALDYWFLDKESPGYLFKK